MSKEPNLNMQFCSRFKGAFAHVETTPSTPARNYWSTVEQRVTSCPCRLQRGRDLPSTN